MGMSQSYNAACAIARRPNQTDALAMKEAPNTISAFAIVFSIILDLDIFVLKYPCGFSPRSSNILRRLASSKVIFTLKPFTRSAVTMRH
jgi:hypothetical protein